MPKKIIIAALAENRVIGSENGLPWHIPEEYQQYLEFVRDQTVIMGRKTYATFADDLESAHDLVITRSPEPAEGYKMFSSIEAALNYAETLERTIFIAGGASIYAQTLGLVDEMFLSYIDGNFSGDAFFPEFNPHEWEVVKQVQHPLFRFVHFRRKGAGQ